MQISFFWVQFSIQFVMSGCGVCVFVPLRKTNIPVDWRLLVKEFIANIGLPLDFFRLLLLWNCLNFFRVFCSLGISLLCILRELAGGGSAAVAFGFSDSWQVTGDEWQVTHDTWHLAPVTWHVTFDSWHVTHVFFLVFFSVYFLSVSF